MSAPLHGWLPYKCIEIPVNDNFLKTIYYMHFPMSNEHKPRPTAIKALQILFLFNKLSTVCITLSEMVVHVVIF